MATPDVAQGTLSSARINWLLEIVGGRHYLEIGVQSGVTLEAVQAATVVGVDPAPEFLIDSVPPHVRFYRLQSDEYFAGPGRNARFDVVFVDGLHEYRQTWRDLWNSLERLSSRGVVILGDVIPCDAIAAMPTLQQARAAGRALPVRWSGHWMGDVYRCVEALQAFASDLVDWRTVVDEERFFKTIVWWRGHERRPPQLGEDALDTVGRGAYDEVFSRGAPTHFRLVSDDELARTITAAMTGCAK